MWHHWWRSDAVDVVSVLIYGYGVCGHAVCSVSAENWLWLSVLMWMCCLSVSAYVVDLVSVLPAQTPWMWCQHSGYVSTMNVISVMMWMWYLCWCICGVSAMDVVFVLWMWCQCWFWDGVSADVLEMVMLVFIVWIYYKCWWCLDGFGDDGAESHTLSLLTPTWRLEGPQI